MKEVHLKYNSFNEVLRQQFGEKVFRLSLNLGLTCPNKDGAFSSEGCSFCNDDSILGKSWHKQLDLERQIAYGINYVKERHGAKKYLAHFQNGTNTNAPATDLKPIFESVITHEKIVGLMISTRSDCIAEDILELLSDLNKKTYLWLELGLQSTQNRILEKINRGHSVESFVNAVKKLAEHNIKVCAHIILGLPDETQNEMIEGVNLINGLPVSGIKIHNMFITKNTALAKLYEQGEYTPLELQEYAQLCVDYLERLRPDITIHRLNAHAPERLTVAPKWSVNKWDTLNAVHEEILKRNTFQGCLYHP